MSSATEKKSCGSERVLHRSPRGASPHRNASGKFLQPPPPPPFEEKIRRAAEVHRLTGVTHPRAARSSGPPNAPPTSQDPEARVAHRYPPLSINPNSSRTPSQVRLHLATRCQGREQALAHLLDSSRSERPSLCEVRFGYRRLQLPGTQSIRRRID